MISALFLIPAFIVGMIAGIFFISLISAGGDDH